MTKTPVNLQDLRRSLYIKAKAEPAWRFWGLYAHVCKIETLQEAYGMAKKNDGAPGIDGVTFEAIEESGVESFLQQIRDELVSNTYRPMRARKSRWLHCCRVNSHYLQFLFVPLEKSPTLKPPYSLTARVLAAPSIFAMPKNATFTIA